MNIFPVLVIFGLLFSRVASWRSWSRLASNSWRQYRVASWRQYQPSCEAARGAILPLASPPAILQYYWVSFFIWWIFMAFTASLQMSHYPSAWRERNTASEAGPKGYQQEVKTQKAFKISERLNICKADGREKRPESRSAFGVRKVGRCPESLWWKVFPWSAYQRSH